MYANASAVPTKHIYILYFRLFYRYLRTCNYGKCVANACVVCVFRSKWSEEGTWTEQKSSTQTTALQRDPESCWRWQIRTPMCGFAVYSFACDIMGLPCVWQHCDIEYKFPVLLPYPFRVRRVWKCFVGFDLVYVLCLLGGLMVFYYGQMYFHMHTKCVRICIHLPFHQFEWNWSIENGKLFGERERFRSHLLLRLGNYYYVNEMMQDAVSRVNPYVT